MGILKKLMMTMTALTMVSASASANVINEDTTFYPMNRARIQAMTETLSDRYGVPADVARNFGNLISDSTSYAMAYGKTIQDGDVVIKNIRTVSIDGWNYTIKARKMPNVINVRDCVAFSAVAVKEYSTTYSSVGYGGLLCEGMKTSFRSPSYQEVYDLDADGRIQFDEYGIKTEKRYDVVNDALVIRNESINVDLRAWNKFGDNED